MQEKRCLHTCAHTHSTQPFSSSSFCPYNNFPNAKPQLTWVNCPAITQDLEENSIRFHWAVHYTVKHQPWRGSLPQTRAPSQGIIPLSLML